MRRKIFASLAGLALATGALGVAPAMATGSNTTDNYIVVFKDGTSSAAQDAGLKRVGSKANLKFSSVINAATAQLTPGQVKKLSSDPSVSYVELDGVVTTAGTQSPVPSWGLDRIDQVSLPSNNKFNYPDTAGSGVKILVVDTGLAAVNDLVGRTGAGFTSINDGRGTVDCDGHGTHVAGTAAGTNYGVAKLATVIPVRVLDCTGSGSWSGVIAGLDWIRANFKDQKAVVNMSLGGGASSAVDTAVNNLVNAGVTVVVAAGNSARDACNFSPARVSGAVTVGATTSSDAMASYSNFGRCLDIFAPGSNIISSNLTGGSVSFNGTSMASPHVAGAAALVLGSSPTNLTPAQVTSALDASSSKGVIKLSRTVAKSTANKLLFISP